MTLPMPLKSSMTFRDLGRDCITCNPQGQAIVERTIRALTELLARTFPPEDRRDPHLTLTEVLFHMDLISFDDKGLRPTYKH